MDVLEENTVDIAIIDALDYYCGAVLEVKGSTDSLYYRKLAY